MGQAQDKAAHLSRELEHLRRKLKELEALKAELEDVKEALRDSETRYQAVTSFPKYAVISIDSQKQVVSWNKAAESIFGYHAKEVLGKPISMVIPDLNLEDVRESVTDPKENAPDSPKSLKRSLELIGLRKNGDEFPVELSLSCWISIGEVFFSTILRDISYRKKALKRLEIKTAEAGQKTEDLESLIQAVAHDLKSPVIAIAGLARRLQTNAGSLPSDPMSEKLLSQIESGAQTIERFLKDLLDGLALSQSDQDWTLIEMDAMIGEVVQQHEHEIAEQGIAVQMGVEQALPPIAGNKHRLAQVLDNLLVNAIVHMGQRPDPTIRIECRCEKGFVLTSVSDNGTGIAPEHQGKIFERFFRTPEASGARGGTGLGLFIAKKIVESHQGRIWVESDEGKGATFVFKLPVKPTAKGGDYEI